MAADPLDVCSANHHLYNISVEAHSKEERLSRARADIDAARLRGDWGAVYDLYLDGSSAVRQYAGNFIGKLPPEKKSELSLSRTKRVADSLSLKERREYMAIEMFAWMKMYGDHQFFQLLKESTTPVGFDKIIDFLKEFRTHHEDFCARHYFSNLANYASYKPLPK